MRKIQIKIEFDYVAATGQVKFRPMLPFEVFGVLVWCTENGFVSAVKGDKELAKRIRKYLKDEGIYAQQRSHVEKYDQPRVIVDNRKNSK
jgi:hypothetical protein